MIEIFIPMSARIFFNIVTVLFICIFWALVYLSYRENKWEDDREILVMLSLIWTIGIFELCVWLVENIHIIFIGG